MLTAALALLALAVPQNGVALLKTDDVLPGGLTVTQLVAHAISDSGSWVAIARTVDAASVSGNVLVQDGAVLMRQEDVLLSGERVRFIVGVDISPADVVASIVTVYDASGTTGSIPKLALDGRTVLARDDALVGTGVPPGAVMRQIKDVRHRGSLTLVDGTIFDSSAGERDALLLFSSIAAPGRTVDVLALEDAPVPGLTAPFTTLRSRMAVATDGTAAAPVRIGTFANGREAIVSDSGALMEEGTPGPFPGSTWSSFLAPTVAAATGGRYAFCCRVLEAAGTETDVIMRDGAVFAQKGQPHPGYPGSSILNLTDVPLERSSAGELFYTARVSSIGWVLAVESEPLIVQNMSMASGLTVVTLSTATNTLAISDSGQFAVIQAGLSDGSLALVLAERSVGETTGCSVISNSTGTTAKISASGSAYAAQADLAVQVTDLPMNSFGYLNGSRTSGFVAHPAGSSGNLCLGGAIGRFVGQIQSSGSSGSILTGVDVTAIPQPNGPVGATAGETWFFQLWHRDTSGSGATTSNFSASLAVTFR